MSIAEALLIRRDLDAAAEKGLILSNYLHLFYLLTPYSAVEEFKIDRETTIAIVSELY